MAVSKRTTISVVYLSMFCFYSECATYTQVKTEYTKLVDGYAIAGSTNGDQYSQTIPTDNLPMEVSLNLFLYSLSGYDPVAGTIDVVGSLNMEWIDEYATTASPTVTFDSDTVSSFFVDYSLIWTPVIVLMNSANSVERVGDQSYKARYQTATGKVTWEPRVILKATCTPDVTFFPFDEQKCTLTFQSWIHDSTLVQLHVASDSWGTDDYEGNGIWAIDKTSSKITSKGGYFIAEFDINIRRNALYFTLNVVLPILLLSALSGCLFLLPASSGSRVGFGIGCFLAFVVLLQTTMTFLPEASAPMSILCYYIIMMMTLSAVLSIVNVLLLKIHMADEETPLPKLLVHFVELVKCIKFRRWRRKRARQRSDVESLVSFEDSSGPTTALKTKTSNLELQHSGVNINKNNTEADTELVKVLRNDVKRGKANRKHHDTTVKGEGSSSSTADSHTDNISERTDIESEKDEDEVADWKSVGSFLDFFFILVFVGTQAALSVFFLVPLASRAA